jgi:peptidoglycan/LPS O-acetylase OafA/YrhL
MKEKFYLYTSENKLLIPTELSRNNFDFLRFFLAVIVIYSHCFMIYYGDNEGTEPAILFTHNQADLGDIAVCFFFIISGFLVVKSFENSGTISEYLVKRILRICPGFFVAFIISVFVFGALGALFSSHIIDHLKYYFQSFNIKRLTLQFFTLEVPNGPKTFSGAPLPNLINQSFWTIQMEFTCYLIVPLLALSGMLKRKWLALSFFLVFYNLLVLQMVNVIPSTFVKQRNWVFLYPSEIPRLFAFFFAGACFYLFRDHIKFSKLLILLSIVVTVFACLWLQGFYIVFPFTGTYLIFCFAYNPRIRFYDFAKRGDLSYGLYLYGWPVGQLVMYFFGKHIDANRLFFISFPIVFLSAYLSWHIVEDPFLKMKRFIKEGFHISPVFWHHTNDKEKSELT